MPLVIVGGASAEVVEAALRVFEATGFARTASLDGDGDGVDRVLGVAGGGAETLRAADGLGLRYLLVHSGDPDGQPDGTYDRAHHRVRPQDVAELARSARTRERLLVTCLAFGYKNGIPPDSAWVVDVRFLDNPYWEPELKPLTGLDPPVREYVLRQPAAGRLLEGLGATFEAVLDDYRRRGRMRLTLAFGCTGGRHRSVVMAAAMAERLRGRPDLDVELRAREL